MILRTAFVLGLACLSSSATLADVPTDAAARAKIVGDPMELTVQPAEVALTGPHALQQLIVTGKYADGTTAQT